MTEFVGPGNWPYEDPTAVPFGPNNQQASAILQNALTGAGVGYAATNAARTAMPSNTIQQGQAFAGLHVYDAQDDAIYMWNGTAWLLTEQGWKTFTPTFTGLTLGTGGSTLFAAYRVYRGEVHCRVGVQLGTSGFSVTAPLLTPPLTIGSTSVDPAPLGMSQMVDSSASVRYTGTAIQSSTSIKPFSSLVSGTTIVEQNITASIPFTWAASDQLFIDVTYPL